MFLRWIILVLVFILQGCVVSGAVTGAQLYMDRDELRTTYDNQSITYDAYQAVENDSVLSTQTNITMSNFNHILLMTGQAPTPELKQQAEDLVKKIPGVRYVLNDIVIGEPTSGWQHTQDAWITTKIKTKMITTNGLTPGNFKVVTEDGIVYLMGAAPPDQVEKAVEIARNTDGVTKVVKLVYYIYYSVG